MILLLSLLGCPFVSTSKYAELADADGDGVDSIRFGGLDCDDLDPDIGNCDRDGDGYRSTLAGGDDCDDEAFDINPGQVERCDGVDNDCDRRIDDADDAVEGTRTWFRDEDGDGYGGAETLEACVAPASYVALDGDCNDAVSSIFPAAAETCDGVDRNCDGSTDDGATREWFADEDGDGFGDANNLVSTSCVPPADAVANGNDCDDTNALAHPTGFELADPTEVCDGIDNDCDGRVDDEDPGLADPDALQVFADTDGDGFGDGLQPRFVCSPAEGFVGNDLDCDDSNALARPGPGPTFSSAEVCDGFDNDCDGLVDGDDPSVDTSTAFSAFPDADGDGYGNAVGLAQIQCTLAAGFATNAGDCDDGAAEVNPGAPELCGNNEDDDCDGLVDTLDPSNDGSITWYQDLDADGFGETAITQSVCAGTTLPGYSPVPGDCNDQDPEINDVVDWYPDLDGDGFGNRQGGSIASCFPLASRSRRPSDCDDQQVNINPEAVEICDGLDNDCSGTADDGAPGAVLGYPDADGDGFGDRASMLGYQCSAFTSVALNALDCDDHDPDIRPGAPEACFEDRDCDGLVGDDDPDVVLDTWYLDLDLDGFGDPDVTQERCAQPPGYVPNGLDCDPVDPGRYFANYRLRPGTGAGNQQPTLQEIIDHRGRCLGTPTRVTVTDGNAQMTSLSLPASDPGLILEGGGTSLCWAPDASLTTETTFELHDLTLTFGALSGGTCLPAGSTTSPFVLANGGALGLDGVTLPGNNLAQPLIRQAAPAQASDASSVQISRSTFTALRSSGSLIDLPAGGHVVQIERSTFNDLTANLALIHVAGSGSLDFTENDVLGGSMRSVLHTEGLETVAVADNRLRDIEVTGAAVCVDGSSCTDTGVSAAFDAGAPTELTLLRNEVRRLATVAGTDATLVWMAQGTVASSSRNHFEGGLHPGGPALWIPGTQGGDGIGWSSDRDRWLQLPGGMSAERGTHRFTHSQWVGGFDFDLAATDSTMELGFSTLVDGSYGFGVSPSVTQNNIFAEADWSGASSGELGHTYVLAGTPLSSECSTWDCLNLDPFANALVSYGPNVPPERWILYPYDDDLVDSFPYAGVPWFLDPNADGLPIAWQAFHADTPECRDVAIPLFDETADVDHDGLNNAEEVAMGTWPCIDDTDDDGALDGFDADPLNALVQ